MPQPQTKTPDQFSQDIIDGWLSKSSEIDDFSDNTPEAALAYSIGTQHDFVQTQNLDSAALMRLASSEGTDLDSYVNDWVPMGFTPRLPAVEGTTQMLFGHLQPNPNQVVIPFGTIIQTPAAPPALPVQFALIPDPNNPASSVPLGGYVFPANALTMQASARCLLAGTVGNVNAGTLTVIATPNVPADTVTNPNGVSNGQPQEQDGPLRQRFADWFSGLALGVERAICAAVAETQVGIAFTYNDLTYTDGTAKDGFFTIVADDGSGAISAGLLAEISTSVSGVRAGGVGFGVVAPTNQTVSVALAGTQAQPGFVLVEVQAAIQQAVIYWINTNGPGGSRYGTGGLSPTGKVPFIGLIQLVESFVGTGEGQGLLGYASLQLNGAYTDVALTNFQLARTDAAHVTIS